MPFVRMTVDKYLLQLENGKNTYNTKYEKAGIVSAVGVNHVQDLAYGLALLY